MKKIGIMTDSHSGILTEEAEKLGIKVLPMPFYIDDELYLEVVDLSREEFYEKLRQGVNVSTSQPSPQEVMETWPLSTTKTFPSYSSSCANPCAVMQEPLNPLLIGM